MKKLLILGAGRVGSLIACLMHQSGDYEVHLGDCSFSSADNQRLLERFPELQFHQVEVSKQKDLRALFKCLSLDAVISCLPFYLNEHVAKAAFNTRIHYFDLTEDTHVTAEIHKLARTSETAFVPQCGLAPGFSGIVANQLMKGFERVESVKIRVGALPQHVDNALHYALSWSTEGLINQYLNPCYAILNGQLITMQPLADLETVQLDGSFYEAFTTSGGLGSLAKIYQNKVEHMSYKTLRYPGHCQVMRTLIRDFKLRNDRQTLKRLLENALPKTTRDVVVIFVSVTGYRGQEYLEETFVRKIYPQQIADLSWTALQISTAAGVCVVVDLFFEKVNEFRGLVYQELFSMDAVLGNRFGKYLNV